MMNVSIFFLVACWSELNHIDALLSHDIFTHSTKLSYQYLIILGAMVPTSVWNVCFFTILGWNLRESSAVISVFKNTVMQKMKPKCYTKSRYCTCMWGTQH